MEENPKRLRKEPVKSQKQKKTKTHVLRNYQDGDRKHDKMTTGERADKSSSSLLLQTRREKVQKTSKVVKK
jgi:hypothetical protein